MPTLLRGQARRLLPLLLLGLLPLLSEPRAAAARGGATTTALAERLEARATKAGLREGRYAVVVLLRGERPEVLCAVGAGLPLVPASAAKVLTAAAALDMLGPAHVFHTRLTARGPPVSEGVLEGDLVLHGAADPDISGRFFGGERLHVPARLAQAVVAAGIRSVTGALVLDEGPLDQEYVHADWSAADRLRWYGAPVGGLSFNDNCVDVTITGAAQAGGSPRVDLPATLGPWRLQQGVQTVAGAQAGAGGRWLEQGGVLALHGRVPPGGSTGFEVPVPDPALFFGGALLHALREQGVRVAGGTRHARDAADRLAGELLGEHFSEMTRSLTVMNTRSQNMHAGTLFKLAGAAYSGLGTWASGEAAVKAMLERRRIPAGTGLVLRDGSGLSAQNRIPASVLAQVLASFDRDPLRGPILHESLPVSGVRGTLESRMGERGLRGRVHAKTGTLNESRTRALAGYVDGVGGHPGYVFAILLNGPGASHALIDDLVREIAR